MAESLLNSLPLPVLAVHTASLVLESHRELDAARLAAFAQRLAAAAACVCLPAAMGFLSLLARILSCAPACYAAVRVAARSHASGSEAGSEQLVWEGCGNMIQAMDETSQQPGWLEQMQRLVLSWLAPCRHTSPAQPHRACAVFWVSVSRHHPQPAGSHFAAPPR